MRLCDRSPGGPFDRPRHVLLADDASERRREAQLGPARPPEQVPQRKLPRPRAPREVNFGHLARQKGGSIVDEDGGHNTDCAVNQAILC